MKQSAARGVGVICLRNGQLNRISVTSIAPDQGLFYAQLANNGHILSVQICRGHTLEFPLDFGIF